MDSMAERSRSIRTTSGMSARAFSEFLALSPSMWSEIENGQRTPGGAVFRGLAQRGFSVDWLLTGEGTMLRGQPANMDETTHFKTMQLAAELNLSELAASRTVTHLDCHERIGMCLQRHSEGRNYAELLQETGFEARQLKGFLKWLVDENIIRQEKGRYKLIDKLVRRNFIGEYKGLLIDVFRFYSQVLIRKLGRGEPDARLVSLKLTVPCGQEAETVKSLVAQLRASVESIEQTDSASSTSIRIIFAACAEPS